LCKNWQKEEILNFQDCIKFAKENPTCAIATVEKDQARVRFVEVWRIDDSGFYFQTESSKAFCKQLKRNPKMEVCFILSKSFQHHEESIQDPTEAQTMRVTGEVEFVDDLALKTQCLEARPYLKNAGIEKPDDPKLVMFRICKGEAFFWSLAYTCRESEIPRIQF
jgi:pyridoxamine 5'-phosphate oxidase